MDETQKQYEMIFILSPQLEGAGLDKTKKEIGDIITKFKGTINFKESEKKNLAYPINKQGQGIFLVTQVSISPENIANLSKELKLNKQILRHLINQLEIPKPETAKPKPIKKPIVMKKKLVTEKEKPSSAKTPEGTLEEIDKKLDEIIDKI